MVMSRLLRIELLILAFIIITHIFHKIRKGRIETKYTLTWVFIAIVFSVAAIFPNLVVWLTAAFGIETPSNFVYGLGLVTLLLIALNYAGHLSKQESMIRELVQTVSIMRKKIERLEEENERNGKTR